MNNTGVSSQTDCIVEIVVQKKETEFHIYYPGGH